MNHRAEPTNAPLYASVWLALLAAIKERRQAADGLPDEADSQRQNQTHTPLQ